MSEKGIDATPGGEDDELAYRNGRRDLPKPLTATGLEKVLNSVCPFAMRESETPAVQELNLAYAALVDAARKILDAKERVSAMRGELDKQDQHEESTGWPKMPHDGYLIDSVRQNKRGRFAGTRVNFKMELKAFHAAVKTADGVLQTSRAKRPDVQFASEDEHDLFKYNLWCFDELVDFFFMQLHSLYQYLRSMPTHRLALTQNCPQTSCGRSISWEHADPKFAALADPAK
jgi:hypothetical protein